MIIFGFIAGQVIILAVIIFVLKKVIFSDTDTALNRLNKEHNRVEKDRIDLEQKKKQCEEECKLAIDTAKAEAARVLKEERIKGEEERAALVGKARQEADDIVKKALDSKEKIRKELLKEVTLQTVDFARAVLEKALERNIFEKFNETLSDDFVDKLEEIEAKYIGSDVNSVEIISRYPLSDGLKDKMKDILKRRLGRQVAVTEKHEDSVIAGVILKFGTLALDGSLAFRISEVSEEFKKIKESEST